MFHPTLAFLPLLALAGAAHAALAPALDVPGDHPTIQAAIDAAPPDATIRIAAGVYRERVVIPAAKAGLRIRGAGNETIVDAHPSGAGEGSGIAIHAPGVRLEKLLVRHASDCGVRAAGADAVLKRVTSVGSGTGIEAAAPGFRAESSTTIGSKNFGFRVTATAPSAVLRKCTSRAERYGFHVAGDGVLLDRCRALESTNYGVSASGKNARVRDCRIRGSAGRGIYSSGDDTVVEGNEIAGTSFTGIDVLGAGGAVRDNAIAGTGFVAIDFHGTGVVAGNSIRHSVDSGLRISGNGSSGGLVSVEVSDNAVRSCGMSSSAGIRVFGTAVQVDDNLARDCRSTGLWVIASDCEVSENRVVDNAGDGIAIIGSRCSMLENRSEGNCGFGLKNHGAADVSCTGNRIRDNRIDVVSSGTFAVFEDNDYETGGPNTLPD